MFDYGKSRKSPASVDPTSVNLLADLCFSLRLRHRVSGEPLAFAFGAPLLDVK